MKLDHYGYVVFCCGCTDCFPHAAFFNRAMAEEWAKKHCRNPEGFIIKECRTAEEFLKQWSYL